MIVVKKVDTSPVTEQDLLEYNAKIKNNRDLLINAASVGLDKRIVTLNLEEGVENIPIPLTLVNPVLTEYLDTRIAYPEYNDYNKIKKREKLKRVIRYPAIKVQTDNHGMLEFGVGDGSNEMDKDVYQTELFKCVLIQRLIDSVDGIDINHASRRYNIQRTAIKKIGRNDRVVLKSQTGDVIMTKHKFSQKYLEMGYTIM